MNLKKMMKLKMFDYPGVGMQFNNEQDNRKFSHAYSAKLMTNKLNSKNEF